MKADESDDFSTKTILSQYTNRELAEIQDQVQFVA